MTDEEVYADTSHPFDKGLFPFSLNHSVGKHKPLPYGLKNCNYLMASLLHSFPL